MKYLYGASVQGIQDFIFQTNKLREIVGASELVEQICTTKFLEVAGIHKEDTNIILNAAGNIKYIFDDIAKCEQFVKFFPKTVMNFAPGISISQAVVKYEILTNEIMQELENRLRIQRNKSIKSIQGGFMVIETARKTGQSAIMWKGKEAIDSAQYKKLTISKEANSSLFSKIIGSEKNMLEKFPFEMEEIANDEHSSWVAVIHADGNDLGQLLMTIFSKLPSNSIQNALKEFSTILNDSTVKATKTAFEDVVEIHHEKKIPFRPVILGGDDLTVIIRGDLALSFTKKFLTKFEEYTKFNFSEFSKKYNLQDSFENGLSACAGISYIKTNYPFHYGVKLSEDLCKQAKKVSKDFKESLTPSSLLFHKVHASFIENYDGIVEKELTAPNDVRFDYGPYFLNDRDGYSTIKELEEKIIQINKSDSPKSGLRNWLSELRVNPENAEQLIKRVNSITNQKFVKKLHLETPFSQRKNLRFTPIFDIVALSNIQKAN